jgi:transporter family-2 protein
MDSLRYTALMLLAGIGVPLLATLNAQLGARIGSPTAAAVVLFALALAASLLCLILLGGFETLALIPLQPPHLFFAGLLIAFYVLSITWVAPRFGVGNAIFCVLLGQLASAAVIDQFGLYGAIARPIDVMRGVGIALMALGVAVTQFAASR